MTDRRFVPHFNVTTIQGERCEYATLWQRMNLLLVVIPTARSSQRDAYVADLEAHMADLTAHETACVITSDNVSGLQCPAIVIADRWGEMGFLAQPQRLEDLPGVDALIDWLRHVQARCPECEGEAR
jgi:hypothetical protein